MHKTLINSTLHLIIFHRPLYYVISKWHFEKKSNKVLKTTRFSLAMATDIESRNLSAWFIEQINHIIEGNPSNHSTVKILLHNLTKLLKDSHYNGTHILKELENGEENYDLDRITENRRVGYVAFCVLITLYSIVIFAGSCGNGLVIWAVIRRPTMR